MPYTNLDVVKRAMKKLHVLPNRTEPGEAQAFDGMALLQSLIMELIGQGSLGRLNDVLATAAYTAREFDRVHASHGVVVTLPTTITDALTNYPFVGGDWPLIGNSLSGVDYGSTYSTTPRPPYDRVPIVVITDNIPVFNVWNTYLNEWVVINDLKLQDLFPFADYLMDGFGAMLAERWADDWQTALGAETKRQAGMCRLMLSTKPDSPARPAAACYF